MANVTKRRCPTWPTTGADPDRRWAGCRRFGQWVQARAGLRNSSETIAPPWSRRSASARPWYMAEGQPDWALFDRRGPETSWLTVRNGLVASETALNHRRVPREVEIGA